MGRSRIERRRSIRATDRGVAFAWLRCKLRHQASMPHSPEGRNNMPDRRSVLATGPAAAASLTAAPLRALAQPKPMAKVRYNEVVRSVLYVPSYVAISKGYFEEQGIEQTIATAQGGDKSMAALLSNGADIALMGPESPIYVLNSDSPLKVRIFCALTSTDGFMLLGREKVDKFDWKMLKGKDILGFRPGSTPLLFFEEAMRKNGIDPQKDVKL